MTNKQILALISSVLVGSGLTLSIYLFETFLNLTINQNEGRLNICSTAFNVSCDSALLNTHSIILEIPLAGWGIIFYCTLLLLKLTPFLFGKSFETECKSLTYIFTFTGVIIGVGLLVTMLFSPFLFCPLCAIIHGINLLLFFTLNKSNGFNLNRFFVSIRNGFELFRGSFFKYLFSWKSLAYFTLLTLGIVLYQELRIQSIPALEKPLFVDFKPIWADYQSQAIRRIPIKMNDPVKGRAKSPIEIIVFSDFCCSFCKLYTNELEKALKIGNGNYRIIFKHFPLCTACNPSVEKDLHPLACEAAYAAEAAHKQGKFWEYHDLLFQTKLERAEVFNEIAMKTGLNVKQFENDRKDNSVRQKVQEDIAQAKHLGIDGTPTIFLNGRKLMDMRPGMLQVHINTLLQKPSFLSTQK